MFKEKKGVRLFRDENFPSIPIFFQVIPLEGEKQYIPLCQY